MEHFKDIEVGGLEDLVGATLTELERSYRLDWDNGDWFEINRNGDWIEFGWLESLNGESRLTQLVGCLPSHFRDLGIEYFATVDYEPSREAMLKVGFEQGIVGGYLLCDVSEGGRMDQYTAWKQGDAPEPDWRRV